MLQRRQRLDVLDVPGTAQKLIEPRLIKARQRKIRRRLAKIAG